MMFIASAFLHFFIVSAVVGCAPTVSDAFTAPPGFEAVGSKFAYKFIDTNFSCTRYSVCNAIEVVGIEKCNSLQVQVSVRNRAGDLLASATNTYSPPIRNMVPDEDMTRFGIVEIGIDNPAAPIYLGVSQIRCLQDIAAAPTITSVELPRRYCEKAKHCRASYSPANWLFRPAVFEHYLPQSSGSRGGTVICADGWVSHSKGKQGSCSSHGGVGD